MMMLLGPYCNINSNSDLSQPLTASKYLTKKWLLLSVLKTHNNKKHNMMQGFEIQANHD